MGIEAGFDKYEREGAYHWRHVEPRWLNGRFSPPLVARYRALLDLLPAGTPKILEIGCGDGCLLYLAGRARPGARLYGVDPVVAAIDHARDQFRRAGVAAILARASAYELPVAERSLDVVLMADVIEHLATPERAVREARRVLRPGGVLLLSTPHEQPDFRWDPDYHFREYDAAALGGLVAPHFTRVEMRGCSSMRWIRLWRLNSGFRLGIRCLSRLGLNPLRATSEAPRAAYAEIIAQCTV